MIPMTLEEIRRACGGTLTKGSGIRITDITTDSRKVSEGCLFAAIVGERTDGHNYIESAARQGAAAVLCEREPEHTDIPCILTGSTGKALQDIAASIRQAAKIPVVGVGGSVGKTSTREAVASVLAQGYSVLKTEGNFNNDLGVPLTLFRLGPEHNAAVLEMGIDDFGQMHLLASIVRPNLCILTNIGDCHLENLKDREGVLRAKSEMFDFCEEGDRIILNGDDPLLARLTEVRGIRPVFYGLDPKCAVWADEIKEDGLNGSFCRIHLGEESFSAYVPKPGIHMVYNALAAAAAGQILGLTPAQIKAGIETQGTVPGRSHIIEGDGLTVIDDCYNANPMSMKASLRMLESAQGRKVAILGDMGELGAQEEELHRQVGRFAAGLRLDALYSVGPLARGIAEEAEKARRYRVESFETREKLLTALPGLVCPGDTVLVKASHFMAFDAVVAALCKTEDSR